MWWEVTQRKYTVWRLELWTYLPTTFSQCLHSSAERILPREYRTLFFLPIWGKNYKLRDFFFFFCLHWQKYQVLLKSQETRASHVTQPWANNWKRYKTGPWLSRLLMSVAMLAFGFGRALRFRSKSPRHLHLPCVVSDPRMVLVCTNWIPSLITSTATQSNLTPAELFSCPLFRLTGRIFFLSGAVQSYSTAGISSKAVH